MSFTDRLQSLIDSKGITKNKMLKDLGFGTGTFATWKTRGTIPNGEILSKISAYFEVSTDYLLGNEQKNSSLPEMDSEALKWADKLRRLTPEQRKVIETIVDGFQKN